MYEPEGAVYNEDCDSSVAGKSTSSGVELSLYSNPTITDATVSNKLNTRYIIAVIDVMVWKFMLLKL
ncbi:hypothetical protein [Maribacter sp.]|uniref:hypothetical protein n=1 Tax=Maribacter sp. TaxID=1897614 RepID=UPI0025BCDD1A|nr:hypothetical protein [Maribacter sp.]